MSFADFLKPTPRTAESIAQEVNTLEKIIVSHPDLINFQESAATTRKIHQLQKELTDIIEALSKDIDRTRASIPATTLTKKIDTRKPYLELQSRLIGIKDMLNSANNSPNPSNSYYSYADNSPNPSKSYYSYAELQRNRVALRFSQSAPATPVQQLAETTTTPRSIQSAPPIPQSTGIQKPELGARQTPPIVLKT